MRYPWRWLFAWALTACGGGSVAAPPAQPSASQPAAATPGATPAPSDAVRLDLLLPRPAGFAAPPELPSLLERAGQLLMAERPGDDPPPDGITAPRRAKAKIEAYFETERRWEDAHLLEVTEVLGATHESLVEPGAGAAMGHALTALLLEDQAALGFGLGPGTVGTQRVDPADLPAALARHDVDFAGLSAAAYRRCAEGAAEGGALAVFCDAGLQRMRLRADALPACAASTLAVTEASASASPPPEGPAPPDGLLLGGADAVPLLDRELAAVTEATRARMAKLLGHPLRAGTPPEPTSDGVACERPMRPSRRLFDGHPDARWLGLTLHCAAADCALTVCGTGRVDTCHRAAVEGSPADVRSWLRAVERLQPGGQGTLLVERAAADGSAAAVAHSVRAAYGPWGDLAPTHAVLSRAMPGLLRCQGGDRFVADWVLDVDRAGRVRAVRAAPSHHHYPMDAELLLEDAARTCVDGALSALRFGRAGGRVPRRLVLSLRVPAALQVDLPVRVGTDAGPATASVAAGLGRDAAAVRLARCLAPLSDGELPTFGICAELDAQGHVHGLSLDPAPLRAARARFWLGAPQWAPLLPEGELSDCLGGVLESLPWSCQAPAARRHLAWMLSLPDGLIRRAAP